MVRQENAASREARVGGRRRMAQFTLDRLRERKRKAEEELRTFGDNEGSQQRAGLHDAPASEERRNILRAIVDSVGNLNGVKVVQPRQRTGRVGVGNRVTVEFDGGESETYTILTDDDAGHGGRPNVISYKSPVGSALIGKRPGETAICKLPDRRKLQLKIKEIKPGGF